MNDKAVSDSSGMFSDVMHVKNEGVTKYWSVGKKRMWGKHLIIQAISKDVCNDFERPVIHNRYRFIS